MWIKFILDDGSTIKIGEGDWIGELMHYDLSNNVMWMKSCHNQKELIQALSTGKVLSFAGKDGDFGVDSGRIVEVKAIEDGKETVLWRKAEAKG